MYTGVGLSCWYLQVFLTYPSVYPSQAFHLISWRGSVCPLPCCFIILWQLLGATVCISAALFFNTGIYLIALHVAKDRWIQQESKTELKHCSYSISGNIINIAGQIYIYTHAHIYTHMCVILMMMMICSVVWVCCCLFCVCLCVCVCVLFVFLPSNSSILK